MKPYPYQQTVLDAVGGESNALLAMALGTGKTATATWLAQLGAHDRVLVVGPLRTFDGWHRTVRDIVSADLREVSNRNKRGKAALSKLVSGAPGWYFIGWEAMRSLNTEKRWDGNVKREVNKSVQHPFNGSRFDVVIADEWHRACNWRSQNFQVIDRIASDRRIALSATPAGGLPVNIWAAYKWLWPDRIPAYTRFADRFFESSANPFSKFGGMIYGREYRPGTVRRLVPNHHVISAEEAYPDMPDVNVQRVECPLSREQKRQYKEWEQDALAWLGEHPVAVDIPAILDMRLRQATLGTLVVTGQEERFRKSSQEWETVDILDYEPTAKSSKLDAMMDIIGDLPDEKHVVYTHSAKFVKSIAHRLDKAGLTYAVVSGQERGDWRRFRDDEEVRVLVAVIPAIAEGVDGLQKVCHVEHWLSQDNSVVLNVQATGRLHRGGQTKRVTRYLYQSPGTIDVAAVEPRLKEKYDNLADSGLI